MGSYKWGHPCRHFVGYKVRPGGFMIFIGLLYVFGNVSFRILLGQCRACFNRTVRISQVVQGLGLKTFGSLGISVFQA